jgi:PTH1 family peptidyl-tRNA hydrolase
MDKTVPAGNPPYLIVGLGNPGPRYAATRHNIGFMVVDEAARRHGLRFSSKQANAEIARGDIAGQKVILAKPQTYMNNSGMAVRALASYYKVPNARIVIVYDEIALPLGTIRIREKGSSAGHNGVKSVIAHMGTENIPRMRVGVDRPADPRHQQIDWVLGRFTKEEQPLAQETIRRAAEAIESIFTIGIERAMNTYNTASSETKAEGPKSKEEGQKVDYAPPEAPPTGDSPRKNDLSLDSIRKRLSRIMEGDKQG